MTDLTKLNQIIENLENESNNLKSFSELYSVLEKLKNDTTYNLGLLKDNNKNLDSIAENIKSDLVQSHGLIKQIELTLVEKINELYVDNKRYQKELDGSLFTRLEKYKSDIHIEIRSIVDQIQKDFKVELNNQLGIAVTKLESKFEIQRKLSKNLILIIIISLIINLIAVVIL